VLEAETDCGRALLGIWMKEIRNGLDRFSQGISSYHSGEFENAQKNFDNVERLYYFGAREAWISCSSVLLEELEKNINSPFTV